MLVVVRFMDVIKSNLDTKRPSGSRIWIPVWHHILRESVVVRLCGRLAGTEVASNVTDLIDQLPAGGVEVPGHHLALTRPTVWHLWQQLSGNYV